MSRESTGESGSRLSAAGMEESQQWNGRGADSELTQQDPLGVSPGEAAGGEGLTEAGL